MNRRKRRREGKAAETTDERREQAGGQTRKYSETKVGGDNARRVALLNISPGFVCAVVCVYVCVCAWTWGVRVPERQKGRRSGRGSKPAKCACLLGELMIPAV